MKTTYRKIFWTFEQKERWLNEMSQNGFHLLKSRSFWRYEFFYDKDRAYQYCFDYEPLTSRQKQIMIQSLLDEGWLELKWVSWNWLQNKRFKIYVLDSREAGIHETKYTVSRARRKRLSSWYFWYAAALFVLLFLTGDNARTALRYDYGTLWIHIVGLLYFALLFAWTVTNAGLALWGRNAI